MGILKIRVHLPWSEIIFIVGSLEMEKNKDFNALIMGKLR
jgi:hypothetical protein